MMKQLFEQLKEKNAKVTVYFFGYVQDGAILDAQVVEVCDEYASLLDRGIAVVAVYQHITCISYH